MNSKVFIGFCVFLSLIPTLVSAKILYYSSQDNPFNPALGKDIDFDIFMMNDDGRNVRKLTDTPFSEQSPRWSPDGKQIAYVKDLDITLSHIMQTDLFIMDIDGTNEIRLTDHPAADGPHIAWSPDGRKIAFVSLRTGHIDIHVVDVASRVVTQLTNNAVIGGLSSSPDWSPNGRHIAYSQVLRGRGRTIFTMDAGGGNQKPLIESDVRFARSSPRWSPDGDAILYKESEFKLLKNRREKLAERIIIHQFHSGKRRIIKLPTKYIVGGLAWMHQGQEIVFDAHNTVARAIDLFRYHISRRKMTNLTVGPGGGSRPDWIHNTALTVMPAGKLALQWGQLKRGD
ncbi:MAG: DPP IV N-terminal domain-containing protein [Candidatus Poribacteria bacterium]|nr:DPP IV N-terminal domain-containing protein [Candidatus Poribacteria bacterium]